MGDELGSLFSFLWSDYLNLHQKWNEYIELFATDEKRLHILNETAPGFFRLVQDMLWQGILVHLCRISDSVEHSKKSNAVIRRMLLLAPDMVDQLEPLLLEVERSTAFAREARNKQLAHSDLDVALSQIDRPKLGSRSDIRSAIESIDQVMHVVELRYLKTATAYNAIRNIGGAKNLLYYLRERLRAQNGRMERLRSGSPLPEDLKLIPPL